MTHRSIVVVPLLMLLMLNVGWGQDQAAIEKALKARVIDAELPWHEVQDYTESRVLPMPEVTSVEQWEKYIAARRAAVLKDVVFQGEAARWRDAETKVEWLDEIPGGPGYTIRKLRYEAIPGLWIPALMYLPEQLEGKVPVVLNVNGHDGNGKAADYKQIRCINQAKRGMIALNVEWPGMGQLRTDGFNHYKSNQIDLCGTSGVATHYLYMTRGIDILLSQPHADPERVAVAGLSGGGWQTIFVSALDTRVTLSNPVAGYSSFITRARHTSDLGDSEQTPVDLAHTADYQHLTAMRAPRPTLLTFNAQDQCCFRADHALQPLLDCTQPIYKLYGKESALRSHVNKDPGTHNFLLDNRQQFYKMLGDFFYAGDQSYQSTEIPVDDEIKTAEELHVELPAENLDFHKIAVQLAEDLPAPHILAIEAQRAGLKQALRYEPYEAQLVQRSTLDVEGIQATNWRLRVGSEWTVPATEFVPQGKASGSVVLVADGGRASAAATIATLLKEQKRVVAVDPFYFGESKITQRDFLYGLLVSSVGKRPLGIQAAQVAAVAELIQQQESGPVELYAVGNRTGLISLSTAALNPELFQSLTIEGGFKSLKEIITQDLTVSQAPELFCFGLLKAIDISEMKSLALPCKIVEK